MASLWRRHRSPSSSRERSAIGSAGRRKSLTAFNYGLGAFTKPVFPLAPSVGWLVAARFVDRAGKGILGAPRNALVADITPAELRGVGFGLRQSLDTVRAFLGSLLAIALMWLTVEYFLAIFWIAVILAFLAFALVVFAVWDPRRPAGLCKFRVPLRRSEPGCLGGIYW